MVVKQLSVFLENREGRLEKVTETLRNAEINIVSLSLADTREYGMLRMIVSSPEQAKNVLKKAGFSAMLTDVMAVKLAHQPGQLHELLSSLVKKGISVEYMYTIALGSYASIIIKTSNIQTAMKLLEKENYSFFKAEDIYENKV